MHCWWKFNNWCYRIGRKIDDSAGCKCCCFYLMWGEVGGLFFFSLKGTTRTWPDEKGTVYACDIRFDWCVYWSSYSSQVSTCQLNCVTWHQREQRVTTTTSAISAFLFFFFLLSQFNWWYTTWGHFLPLSCPTEPMCYWRVLINRSNTILFFFFFFFLQDLIIGLQQSLRHRRRNRNVTTATTTRRSPAAAVIRTLLQFRRYSITATR